jgi:hypothetical protein
VALLLEDEADKEEDEEEDVADDGGAGAGPKLRGAPVMGL